LVHGIDFPEIQPNFAKKYAEILSETRKIGQIDQNRPYILADLWLILTDLGR
jgi:hypothetical protein